MTQGSRSVWRLAIPSLTLLLGSSLLVVGGGQDPELDDPPVERIVSSDNCTFLSDPVRFTDDSELRYAIRSNEMGRVVRWSLTAADQPNSSTVDPNSIPRRNLIDDEIFPRMAAANIRSAPLASDAEYLRRVTLDLTGRIPSAADVTAFMADSNTNKREAVVDALVASTEFGDKWTMFFGDLFQNNSTNSQVQRGIQGRDAFYLYLRQAIGENRPYDVIARELMTATGDSWVVGAANWPYGNFVSGGPAQDTYDGAAVDLAQMFLGINAVDCLLCHDGNRHLDQVNLWGAGQTRQNLWGLAAYFSRVTMQRVPNQQNSLISDNTTGVYRLNTTSGNRSTRAPIGSMTTITPRNPFTGTAEIQTGETYRAAIARQITGDLQFSRAAVNYVWEKMMVEALVSPSNGFDLARLDANNPPPEPWTLQPTNPKLLDRLARFFQDNGYNLQLLAATIAKSSAYQLSSTYSGTWNASYVPYYARHYVRRLDGEEIADAVVKATGIAQTYTFNAPSVLPPVQWAMQLPDTQEPRNGGGGALAFMNAFGRGDRDLNSRRFDGSVLQGLTQMNNAFINNRMHQRNAGSRVAALLQQTTDPTTIVDQLYLNTLSRPATDGEMAEQLSNFQRYGNLVAAENLQWVLLNRLQFLFNY